MSHTVRRRVSFLALSTATIGAVVLTGCSGLGPSQKISDDTAVSGSIDRLVVDSASGNIQVRAGSGNTVQVHREIRHHDDKPSAVPERTTGGTLRLTADCENCSVDYRITVPAGTRLELSAGSGDIDAAQMAADTTADTDSGSLTLSALRGAVDARVGSGDITLDDITGETTAHTGSGTIEATRLNTAQADITASSGDVSLSFATPPGDVTVQADSGNVGIAVPEQPYRVNASTSSGTTAIKVPDDPSAPNPLDLRTGSGDIAVSPS